MRRTSIVIIIMLFIVQYAFSQTTPAYGIREKPQTTKAFINAKIVISPAQTIEKGTLLIKDGIILDVGENVTVPEEAFIIDLDGYTIYPGFIDPFTNYGVEKYERNRRDWGSRAPQFEADRQGGTAANNAIHAEINWVDKFKPDMKESQDFFNAGFTTVQSAKKDGIFRGRSFVTLLGDGISNELILNPYSSQYMSFNKGSSPQEYPQSLMGSIALIRQTFMDINWYRNAHQAYQNNNDQPMPEFNTAIEALGNERYNSFIFDSDDALSLLRAERIAREFDLDFIEVGSGYEYANIDDIKATGAMLILPLSFPKAPEVATYEDAINVSLEDLRHWETAPYNCVIIDEHHIPFAFTSSANKNGKEFLSNLRQTVKKGLPESTALEALTTIPAKICGIDELCGSLDKGKLADFFVTDGDVLKDKTTIYSVWVKGIKNKLKTRPEVDFTGNYDLSFLNFTGDLKISEKMDKLKGSVIIGIDTISIDNVSSFGNKLQFSFTSKLDSLNGVTRFSGRKSEDILGGIGVSPDGVEFHWSTSPKVTADSLTEDTTQTKNKTEQKKDLEEQKRIARITYPNTAFGRTDPPKQQNVIVKNITVWTSEDAGILKNTDVIIKDGKFAQIGKNLTSPDDYLVINGEGKDMTAGIIDEHSHIAISGDVNECTNAITAEVRIGDVVNPYDINIYRQLSGGVTVSHLLHGSCNAIGGQCQVIKLRWGQDSEGLKFKEARPTIKFALGENVKRADWGDRFKNRYPISRMGVETIIRDEFQTAKEYGEKWNTYNALSKKEQQNTIPPRDDLQLDAALRIIKSQLDVTCHSYVQSEILMLMRLAEQYGFRIRTFTHILEGYKVAPEMAKHGATAAGFSDWWAYKFEVYDAIPYNIALMTEKGVTCAVNSDNPDLARRLNQEAAKSVMYGDMSQEEAIKLCTINPAKCLKVDNLVGSIKVGKDADFVIWNGNPLSIYSKAEQTWIEGRRYFSIEEDQQIRKADYAEKNALIQKVLSSGGDEKSDFSRRGYKPKEKINRCDDNYDYWRLINETN